MNSITYPWDLSTFNGTRLDQEFIFSHLDRLKYNFKELNTKPDLKVCAVISEILKRLLKDNDKNWYVACSNSGLFLNYLSLAVPVSYALTTKMSCMNINTNNLLGKFSHKSYDDIGNDVTSIYTSKLLVYENFFSSGVGTIKFESMFTELFTRRSKNNFPMLMTILYHGNSDGIVDSVLDYTKKTYGIPARCLLQEKAFFKFFEMTEKKIKCQSVPI